MDLHLMAAEPTDAEREAVDARLGPPASAWDGGARVPERDAHLALGGHAARSRRHLLLPALQAVQSRVGWVSEGALNYICERLTVPPAEAWGVATFYALLATTPRPRRVLHVCDDIACRCRGAAELIAELEQTHPASQGVGHGGGNGGGNGNGSVGSVVLHDGDSTWIRSPCLGLCDQAPAAFLTVAGPRPFERLFGNVTVQRAATVLDGDDGAALVARPALPASARSGGPLLARIGVVNPRSLDDYRAAGGYEALRRAFDIGPEAVIREVVDSKLVGRGGAAFPTGRKWEAVARQPVRPHYLVCNADESEPGTFKDRVLMEGDPFALVEAMTIAGFATGCELGYVYIRGEYPLAIERVESAIAQARGRGLLGDDLLGRGVRFDLEVRKGAGAYICGEETATFNSIEGLRGEPRNKPPFPVNAGLFGRPTVINNVETLMNVLPIVLQGGAAFASVGTAQSTGTKLFCLSGQVERPGVYEVPFGTTLRALLDRAGAPLPGHRLTAVLLGGAAGVFVRGDELDIPLTIEGARAAGATLGSGVVMAVDETVDLRDLLVRIAAFFRDESCGQCVPCRVGTVRQEEALHRIATRQLRGSIADELSLIDEVGVAMRDASICGLGQTAYSAVESAIKRLRLFDGAGPEPTAGPVR